MKGREIGPIAAALALSLLAGVGWAEDLREAWDEAIRVNAGFQARQLDRMSANMNLGAARSARLPSANIFAFDSILSQSPADRVPAALAGTGSSAARAPVAFPILGPNQSNFPFALGSITQPLYQGGRLRYNIQAADADVSYRKTEEHRTILDLKLTVAEAYIRVLRANKNLDVARSSTEQLSAFRRDVMNREQEGRATRNEELAAQVSLANARLREIEAQREVDSAWNMYNRYLYRPPTTVVDLQELAGPPPKASEVDQLAAHKIDETLASNVVDRAMRGRPELQGFVERARQAEASARSTLAGLKPQLSFSTSYVFLGMQNLTNTNFAAETFTLSWNIFDSGQTRRRALAQRLQAQSLQKQRADAMADIAQQVRDRLLELEASRHRVFVSGASVVSAEENIRVVTDRYRQGLSIYTEVLDAETRRVDSLNGYYTATYDNALANFRLLRATGEL